jgi:hypothetical protein
MRRAYTSTVVGPLHLAAGVACGVGFGAGTAAAGSPLWLTAAGVAFIVITAVHVSTVRLNVGSGRITVAHGPWSRSARVIPSEAVTSADAENLRWAQVFGIGVAFHRTTTRMTVRPGPTLHLQLTSGEHLRISTPQPTLARRLVRSVGEEEK